MTNKWNTTLYIGVTNDIYSRVYQHKKKLIQGFTSKYNINKLVYYEEYDYIDDAICREKQLKNWHRQWKINLTNELNPSWEDLSSGWYGHTNCHAELVSASHKLDYETLKQVQGDKLRRNNMSDCIFCKIIAGEIPATKVYEDDKVMAFLDINPVNPGHTLVIPKKHSENLVGTADEDLCAVIKAVKKIAPAVMKALEAGGFNLGVNNGAPAGQLVNHLHFHIMPRFDSDGYELWSGRPYIEGQAQQIAEKIKKEL